MHTVVVPTTYFWSNFLFRAKVYLNERPPWSELCVANCAQSWGLRSTASHVLCISEIRILCYISLKVTICKAAMDVASATHTVSYTMLMVTMVPFRVLCAVGLDFEATGGSVVHYCLSAL